METPKLAFTGVRLIALIWFTLGLWQASANLLENAAFLDPNYPGYLFQTFLLRPLLAMILGMALWLSSGWLSRRISKDS